MLGIVEVNPRPALLETEQRALVRHLENAIRTGTFCSYQPDRAPD